MKKQSGGISFNNINVNVQSSNGGIFLGKTQSKFWTFKHKKNVAMGPIRTNKQGESSCLQNINLVFDDDTVANPSKDF